MRYFLCWFPLQVARAIAVFCVNEVIIFDESGKSRTESTNGTFSEVHRTTDPNVLLARILQYLECPQYLRKCFFPKHSDLQYAGTCLELLVLTFEKDHKYSGWTQVIGMSILVGFRRMFQVLCDGLEAFNGVQGHAAGFM